jgi:hypothetical protein
MQLTLCAWCPARIGSRLSCHWAVRWNRSLYTALPSCHYLREAGRQVFLVHQYPSVSLPLRSAPDHASLPLHAHWLYHPSKQKYMHQYCYTCGMPVTQVVPYSSASNITDNTHPLTKDHPVSPTVDSLVSPVFGISYLCLTLPLLMNSRTAICRISLLHNRIIISIGDPTMHCPTYCMDLTLEGLKMTQ